MNRIFRYLQFFKSNLYINQKSHTPFTPPTTTVVATATTISTFVAMADESECLHEIEYQNRSCFWIPCIGSNRRASNWQPIETPSSSSTITNTEDSWWFDGWMKIRNWSELIAGPKWKTFIRTFRKNHNCFGLFGGGVGGGGGIGGGEGTKRTKFQYDPHSYAMNFDEGPEQNGNLLDDDYLERRFSYRYASLPSSAKSSMDLGKGDAAPSLTWRWRWRTWDGDFFFFGLFFFPVVLTCALFDNVSWWGPMSGFLLL